VFYPAVSGEILVKFLLIAGNAVSRLVEDNGSGTGCPLIDGKQITGHEWPPVVFEDSNSRAAGKG
jgi:hypothetical protein